MNKHWISSQFPSLCDFYTASDIVLSLSKYLNYLDTVVWGKYQNKQDSYLEKKLNWILLLPTEMKNVIKNKSFNRILKSKELGRTPFLPKLLWKNICYSKQNRVVEVMC